MLTIGPNGRIKAQVFAKSVIVLGEVTGNVTASDKVDIRDNGSVDGDIVSPRVAIAEGAHFRGSVDMQRKAGARQPQGRQASGSRRLRCRRRRHSRAGCSSSAWALRNAGVRSRELGIREPTQLLILNSWSHF